MSLDDLVEKYRKKNQKILPPVSDPDRADKVFDWSVNHDISTDEADAEILVKEMDEYQRGLAESQAFLEIDGLVDTFDPSEPPKEGAVADPLGELLRAELDIGRESLKMYMKVMSYIYAPIDRAWKFGTNALMYDPLLKSTTGMVKKHAIFAARDREIRRRLEELNREKGGFSDDQQRQIIDEVNTQATEAIKQFNDEETPNVGIADFMKSSKDALKALIPWPGVADDVKTMGEINTESFKRIVGREAPWWYTPLGDIALQTTAMIGLGKIANSLPKGKSLKGVKLTKAEVRAIKKLHKNASQVKKLPVSSNVPTRTQALTVQQKLIALVKSAKSQRPAKELAIHRDRVKKASKLAKVQKNVEGERLVSATKGALAGKAKVPDFEPINLQFSSQEIDTLFNMVNTFDFGAQPFTKGNAILALDELLKGTLINKSQQAGLEQVFGKGLTKALFGKQSITSIIQDISFEIINTPRALLASADVSAAGRQGIIFSVSHPIDSMKSFGRSIRAVNAQYADDIERVTRANRWGQLGDSFGIHSSPTGFTARLTSKEEPYMSRIAEILPFGIGKVVAASERVFTTFLNQQRREVFATQARKWIRKGITPFGPRRIKRDFSDLIKPGQKLTKDQKTFQQFAKFVNHATGRGSLENLQPGALTAMNAVFFSPRFQVSRVQVIGDLINPATTRHARKAIARDLAEFYATGMGIMGLSKAGGAEVELDWKSSDFGKIKVGNTRYNYWGSFQPMARLAGQMFAGEVKSTGTGKIKGAKGKGFEARVSFTTGLILSFLRSKLAPVPGRLVDVGVGETFRGEPVEFTGEFVGKAAFESLVPLFIQDSVDAWKFQGMNAQFPLTATMAFTGIGVQTWELAPHAEVILAKDSLARSTYGKNYDELSFVEVQMLDAEILVEHPGIVELERQAKFESEGVNFLTKQLKEQRRSERFLEKRLNRTFLDSLEQAKVRVGGVDRIFGNWRLNDEQYKEYQEKVAVEMNELFFEMKPLLDTLTDDDPQRYEILAKILRSSKLIAAKEMKIGDID